MSNTDLLPAPEEASERDRQRLDQVRRNVRIRRQYPPLRDEHGREKALQILSDRHDVTPGTARRIIYRQR